MRWATIAASSPRRQYSQPKTTPARPLRHRRSTWRRLEYTRAIHDQDGCQPGRLEQHDERHGQAEPQQPVVAHPAPLEPEQVGEAAALTMHQPGQQEQGASVGHQRHVHIRVGQACDQGLAAPRR